jgi:hypothetical protein
MSRPSANFYFMCAHAIVVLLTAFTATRPVHAQNAPTIVEPPAASSTNAAKNQASAAKSVPQKNQKIAAPLPATPAKPLWSELKLDQQQALSPLASEWDKLDGTQKQKWLVISKKYASLKPDQQIRLQERMRDWVKLTPDQRRAARENYSKAKKLDASRKSEKWEQYQQLPEETKKKLAAEAAAKNRVANLPPVSDNKNRITPPKKGIAEKAKTTPSTTSAAPNSVAPATALPADETASPSN